MKTPSFNHNNKKAYNWLIYKIGDEFIKKYSNLYKGKLYDLGCGTAVFKEFFLNYADEYIGVDWTKTLHDSAIDIVSDLNKKINIESESADTIVSFSVIEHLYNPQTFLDESYRVLKKGGNIIIQVPWQWHIHEEPHDYYRYTPYALRKMFKNAGFDNINIEPTNGYFTTAILKFNYFTKRFVIGPIYIKYILYVIYSPLWFLLQLIAPVLDKLDRNWKLETQGFYIIAKK